MKIRLLNNPGYCGMEDVVFPVEVEVEANTRDGRVYVPNRELYRIGATRGFDVRAVYCFPQGSWEKAE